MYLRDEEATHAGAKVHASANGFKCTKCQSSCWTCSSIEKCDTCLPGMFMTAQDPPQCLSCIEHCEECDNEITCSKCAELYPVSDDGTECVDREGNNTKFFTIYAVIATFGIIIVLLCGSCWAMRSCWGGLLKCCPWCSKVDKFFEGICPCLRDVHHKRNKPTFDDGEELQ